MDDKNRSKWPFAWGWKLVVRIFCIPSNLQVYRKKHDNISALICDQFGTSTMKRENLRRVNVRGNCGGLF
jgi:hypothetical protein